jgi:hypothetical protein
VKVGDYPERDIMDEIAEDPAGASAAAAADEEEEL